MGNLAKACVRSWAVDQDEIAGLFQIRDGHGQAAVERVFTGFQLGLVDFWQFAIQRHCQIQTFGFGEFGTVIQITAHGFLA